MAGCLAALAILAGLLILALNHPVAHLQEIAIGLGSNLVVLGVGVYLVERVLRAHNQRIRLEAIGQHFLLPVALLNESIRTYAVVARRYGQGHGGTKVALKHLLRLATILNDVAKSMPVDVSIEARSGAAGLEVELRRLCEKTEATKDSERVAKDLRTRLRHVAEMLGGLYLVSTAVDGSARVKRVFDKMGVPEGPT